jgi:hypothetical protein
MGQRPAQNASNLPGGGGGAGRFIGAVFGFVFAAIGLTVIVFLWSSGSDDFGSPPLFFKIFGSLIAVVFVLGGGSMGMAALRGQILPQRVMSSRTDAVSPPVGQPAAGYACPHCGAALGAGAEVSPSGDVKCAFCGRWFNIHRNA